MVEERFAMFAVEGQPRLKTYAASPLELFAEELARIYGLDLGSAHYKNEPRIGHALFREANKEGDGKSVSLTYRREPIAPETEAVDIGRAVDIMTQSTKNELLDIIIGDGKNPEVVRVIYDRSEINVHITNLRAMRAYLDAKLPAEETGKDVFTFAVPFGPDRLDSAIAFTRNYINLNR